MNVSLHRKKWYETYGQGTVCDVCLCVHAALCGASDPLSEDKYRVATNMLEDRLNNWDPPSPASAKFDQAVRSLVEATLEELARWGYGNVKNHDNHYKN